MKFLKERKEDTGRSREKPVGTIEPVTEGKVTG